MTIGDSNESRICSGSMSPAQIPNSSSTSSRTETLSPSRCTGAKNGSISRASAVSKRHPLNCQVRHCIRTRCGIVYEVYMLTFCAVYSDFIKATGIMEMRIAVKEKEDAQKLKSKTRERHQPKMGKLDIDYQRLHDAFFRWQTKPKFTIHGDV
uniref:DUF382 domain-containing protein n=1 Tax=Powellomyces hirtus TaxID=109895 RepID=A0A4P8NX69_9FUNG|nr:hypothetical protein [Powellomyces hirtus]